MINCTMCDQTEQEPVKQDEEDNSEGTYGKSLLDGALL